MVWLVVLIFVAPAAIFTAAYNRLLTTQIALKNAFAQMDVLLLRRHELLPNLIETLREHLPDEQRPLDALLGDCQAARESLKSAGGDPGGAAAVQQLAGVDRQLDGALRALESLVQRHPELRGTGVMAALKEELIVTERRVAVARQAYNSAVMTYNKGRQSFPGSIAAGYFGFTPAFPLPAADADAAPCVPSPAVPGAPSQS